MIHFGVYFQELRSDYDYGNAPVYQELLLSCQGVALIFESILQ